MSITRVEGVTLGVEDLHLCDQFLGDAGFRRVGEEDGVITYRTRVNQFIKLVHRDTTALPPAVTEGSTVREITWGVKSAEELDAIAAELERDRAVERGDGVVRSADPIGFVVAFQVAEPVAVEVTARDYNVHGTVKRYNKGIEFHDKPMPLRLIHVAVDIPQSVQEEARAFYEQRLRFKPIDDVRDVGLFLQAEGDDDHHHWFMCHRTNRPGLNHLAFEVPDFDNVIVSGEEMIRRGWKESRRLGRHAIGSNIFRFIHAPFSGRIEFCADMDRMDKSFVTRVHEKRQAHHLWMVKSGGPEHETT